MIDRSKIPSGEWVEADLCPSLLLVKISDVKMTAIRRLYSFDSRHEDVKSVCFGRKSPSILATGGRDKDINLWTLRQTQPLLSLSGNPSDVICLSFNESDTGVVAGLMSSVIRVWDLQQGKLTASLDGHKGPVMCVDVNVSGHIASGSMDAQVKVWDTRTKAPVITYKGHTKTVNSLQFSPDGRWLVTGSNDNSTKLWDLTAGKELKVFCDHRAAVKKVIFHPNELLLASTSRDRTVIFYDLESMLAVGKSGPAESEISNIAFHPEGICLYALCNRNLRIYGWEPFVLHASLPGEWPDVHSLAFFGPQLVLAYSEHKDVIVCSGDTRQWRPFSNRAEDGSELPAVIVDSPETPTDPNNTIAHNPNSSQNVIRSQTSRRSFHERPTPNGTKMLGEIKAEIPASPDYDALIAQVPEHDSQAVFRSRHKVTRSPSRTSSDRYLASEDETFGGSNPATPLTPLGGVSQKVEFNSMFSLSANSQQSVAKMSPSGRIASLSQPQAAMHKTVSNPTFQSAGRSKPVDVMGQTYTILSTSPRSFELSSSPLARQSAATSTLLAGIVDPTPPPPMILEMPPYDPDTGLSSRQEFRVHYANASKSASSPQIVATVPPAPRKTPEVASGLQSLRVADDKLSHYEPFGSVDNQRPVRSNNFRGDHMDPADFIQGPNLIGGGSSKVEPQQQMSEDEVLVKLNATSSSMLNILERRAKTLEMIRTFYTGGAGLKNAVEYVVSTNDLSVAVDFLSVLNAKSSTWTLDVCVSLLPQIRAMLESKFEYYNSTACSSLKIILKNFGSQINSGVRSRVSSIGVDISQEERVRKYQRCYTELLSVRDVIESKPKSKRDPSLREVNLLMQIFDA